MHPVRVNPKDIRQTARELRLAAHQIEDMSSRIKKELDDLALKDEHLEKRLFYPEYGRWQENTQECVQLLQEMSRRLESLASAIECVDGPDGTG